MILDPFLGEFLEGRSVCGRNADWADCYFTQDWTGGFTGGNVEHAYNVDVDWTDPNYQPVAYGSTVVAFSTHEWPHDFYIKSVTNTDMNWCAADYGFRLSAEGGGESDQANHPIGNGNNPKVLCGPPGAIPTPNLPSAVTSIAIESLAHAFSGGVNLFTSWFTLSSSPSQSSPQSIAKQGGIKPQGHSTNNMGTPAWLAVGLPVTSAVNFIQFDASFTSTNAAEGLLTAYWSTNEIGLVDERVASFGLQTYCFALPGGVTNGLYTLSFRLDAFNNTSS